MKKFSILCETLFKKYYIYLILVLLLTLCLFFLNILFAQSGFSLKEKKALEDHRFMKYHSGNAHLYPTNHRGKLTWIDQYGQIILRDSRKNLSAEELYQLNLFSTDGYEICKRRNVGLVSKNAEIIFEPKYHTIDKILSTPQNIFVVTKKFFGKMYYGIAFDEHNWIVPLQSKQKLYYSKTYNELIEIKDDDIIPLTITDEGYAIRAKQTKKPFIEDYQNFTTTIKNLNGEVLTKAGFTMYYPEAKFILYDNNRCKVINNNGNTIIPNYFTNINYNPYGFFIIYQDKEVGATDLNGKLLFYPVFEEVIPYNENYIKITFKGKHGVYNVKEEKITLAPLFDIVEIDKSGYAIIGKNVVKNSYQQRLEGKYALYKLFDSSVLITEFSFDDFKGFGSGYATVKQNNKWGYIDMHGVVLTAFEYKNAYPFVDGLALVQDKNNHWWYINNRGIQVKHASKK